VVVVVVLLLLLLLRCGFYPTPPNHHHSHAPPFPQVQLTDQFSKAEVAYTKDTERKRQLVTRVEELEARKGVAGAELAKAREVLSKASIEPERIRKQAESVSKASDNLEAEIGRLTAKVEANDAEVERMVAKRREAEEVRANLNHKLELHRDTIAHRQRDVEAVERNLHLERNKQHALTTVKMELELQRKAAEENRR